MALLAGGAAAQPAAPPNTPGPTIPERIEPPRSGPGPQGDSVIPPPPGIDPQIHVPAPDPQPNTTPVIPPPGSPGGDPRVQPR
ncbi:hypothetical protein QMO56_24035 [Roseomonas sp. E05]|uniref:hypothetical protein n=1 Tax=Roseomonas sp. E05 TaxID=3046310 RepID=UPI0024B8FCA5|nr:hypothetical protein [Roseomonas sp. E05]MDJ0391186.1 hypothetical protein [Roseomonas sp. E05]